jgi:hypothetical protein
MGFFDSTPGFTQTNGTSAPWGPQQQPLQNAFNRADQLYNQGPLKFFQGQTYANPDPYQTQAINMQAQRAQNGSPVMQGADQLASNTLNGNFLSQGNPYMSGMMDQIGKSIAPQIQSYFTGSRGYGDGNGAAPQAFASAMADAGSKLAYQNYSDERNNQLKTSAIAPSLANQDYTDISQLGQAGAQNQAFAQQPINEAMQRYNFNQAAPWDLLGKYDQAIAGNYGSQTSQQVPFFQPSGASQALGAGLGVAGIGSLLGGSQGGLAGLGNAASGIGNAANWLWNQGSSAASGIGSLFSNW